MSALQRGVTLFQPQPAGLGLFLWPAALYEIPPCISPLRGQLRCSNGFHTHLSIAYVEQLHCVLSALPDTKIAARVVEMKDQQALGITLD